MLLVSRSTCCIGIVLVSFVLGLCGLVGLSQAGRAKLESVDSGYHLIQGPLT